MEIQIAAPLHVTSASGKPIELLPVVMPGMPSSIPAAFVAFLEAGGRRIEVASATADRIQAYMRRHASEALTEDGQVAFTIAGDALVECRPDAVAEFFNHEEESQ